MTKDDKEKIAGKWYLKVKDAERELGNYKAKAKDYIKNLSSFIEALENKAEWRVSEDRTVNFFPVGTGGKLVSPKNSCILPTQDELIKVLSEIDSLENDLKEAKTNLERIS